jgi:membrane-associated phospholipid phosphatase
VLDWGLAVIHRLQLFRSPGLDLLMRGFTFLGNESFFLLLFPFLCWCLDSRLGLRLAVAYSLSGYLNYVLKQALAQPRPVDLVPGIALIEASGFGLPSGHAQGAVVLWGLLALHAVWHGFRRWLWAPAATLMLAVGLSRVYLGVHFPTDVLAGWAVGALVLGAAAWVLRRAGLPRLTEPSAPPPAVRLRGLRLRAPRLRVLPWWAWLLAVSLPAGAALPLQPGKDAVAMVAALWGFVTGHVLRRRFFPGGEEGSPIRRLLRLPVGLAVLLALYLGLKALFPGEGRALYLPLRFTRYALAGAWTALGAPLLFRQIGLGPRI